MARRPTNEQSEILARFAAIEKTFSGLVTETDDRGRCTYASPNHEWVLGRRPDELVGQSMAQYVHPGDRASFATLRANDEAEGLRAVIRVLHADGGWRWIESESRAFRRADGTVHLLSIARDVTEGREMQHRFRFLSDHSPDLIAELDGSGRIVYASAAHRTILGYDPEELLGSSVLEILHPKNRPGALDTFARAEPGGVFLVTFRMRHKNGTWRWIECTGTTYRAADDSLRLLGIARDFTERFHAERELRESRARVRHLAQRIEEARERERHQIAREVHDELGQQLTRLSLDLDGLPDRKGDEYRATLEHARATVGEVLTAVRRLSARLRPALLEVLGLSDALDALARELATSAGWQLDLRVGQIAGLDDERAITVFRIVQEALTNVARHAKAKRVQVRVFEQGDDLCAVVRDDGRGVQPHELRAIDSVGLTGMRERAMALGGYVAISAPARGGTLVELQVPLRGRAGDVSLER